MCLKNLIRSQLTRFLSHTANHPSLRLFASQLSQSVKLGFYPTQPIIHLSVCLPILIDAQEPVYIAFECNQQS
jgi:hypothetical protein